MRNSELVGFLNNTFYPETGKDTKHGYAPQLVTLGAWAVGCCNSYCGHTHQLVLAAAPEAAPPTFNRRS